MAKNSSILDISEENTEAIYLSHKNLIDNIYKKSDINVTEFQIKPEVFNFLRKTSRNRKKKRNTEIEENNEDYLKIKQLKQDVLQILRKLRETDDFAKVSQVEDSRVIIIQEIINNHVEFPRFKGENNLNQSVITKFGTQEYLIPPNCKFFNQNIAEIENYLSPFPQYDFIVMDPPWWNKYIRRLKAVKKEYGYEMLWNESIMRIPLKELTHKKSIVAIWCTNSKSHRNELTEKFLQIWGLKFLAEWKWIKIDINGDLICDFNKPDQKQPFERLLIACHGENVSEKLNVLKTEKLLFSIPSVIHSHKPPLLEIFQPFLPEDPKCLEIFARYLLPSFTSIGLEVIKLQDRRLFVATHDCT